MTDEGRRPGSVFISRGGVVTNETTSRTDHGHAEMKTVEAPAADPATPKRARMVTLRAVLLAMLIMPLNALWVVEIEVVRYSGHPSTISLFFNVVFILTVLLALNGLVKRFRPRWALQPGELLTVYIMLGIGTALTGHDMVEVLTPILSHVH